MQLQESTPPLSPSHSTPALVLCADGGGSKVCVVIRSGDGLEVRGFAGPCNVQSVGYGPAIQAILLATYRALAQLPASYLPHGFIMPNLLPIESAPNPPGKPSTTLLAAPKAISAALLSARSVPATPLSSRPSSPKLAALPPLNVALFKYVWLGLAGINEPKDAEAFMPFAMQGLRVREEGLKLTNDVNLLAAPALSLPGIRHVTAVVCGTGTVGRTIEVSSVSTVQEGSESPVRQLPLVDVGVSRGWGWLLCDEGSAFWIGRLAIRALLFHFDRCTRASLYSSPPEPLLPLHHDLLAYFGVEDPMELIGIVSLTGSSSQDLSIGEATAKRNAFMAGAARTVLRWAFPDDASPPTPPASERSVDLDGSSNGGHATPVARSREEALKLVKKAIQPMVEMTMDLLGDGSVVKPDTTVLALGGGLWQSKGYRDLLQKGLKKEGVEFASVLLVDDAAGVGAKGLASVEFGS